MKLPRSEIKKYLKEALFPGASVNQTIDRQDAVENEKPTHLRDKSDFKTAMSSFLDTLDPGTDFDDMYSRLTGSDMKNSDKQNKKIEETIRAKIRQIIKEVGELGLGDLSLDDGENAILDAVIWAVRKMPLDQAAGNPKKFLDTLWVKLRDVPGDRKANLEAALDELASMKRGEIDDPTTGSAVAAKILGMVEKDPKLIPKRSDTGARHGDNASLEDIAAALGYKSVGKIPDIIRDALKRAKNRFRLDPDELEIIFYETMADYINEAEDDNLITPDEADFLRENPDHVRELESFQQYFDVELAARLAHAPGHTPYHAHDVHMGND